MSKIISIHSFRGGTGKSNSTANLATILASRGMTVGVIDTDIQSPGIHILFRLDESKMKYSLNDYLWDKCEIQEAAYDVTANVTAKKGDPLSGTIFLIPSSVKASEIARVLREGYDVGLLNDGFHDLVERLKLDALLIDTHPGLNEETLLSIAISDSLALILRPDQQDFQGTAVTVEIARKLQVPNMQLIVNKVPNTIDMVQLKTDMESKYNAPVAGILPHSDEMMILASSGVFSIEYPDHPIAKTYQEIATSLMKD